MSRGKDGFRRWDGVCVLVCLCVCECMRQITSVYEHQRLGLRTKVAL